MSDQLNGSTQPDFITLDVGHQYGLLMQPLRAPPPSRGEELTAMCSIGNRKLFLTLHDWSEADASMFWSTGLTFGLFPMRDGYAWLLWTALGWFDAPYTPWLEQPDNREPSWSVGGLGPETGLAISFEVLDRIGIVRALLRVTVSPHFTHALAQVHTRAIARGQDDAETWDAEVKCYNTRLKRYYTHFGSPKDAF